jgi:hypothetical protein
VNFDRLIVARFGAFPQKVIAGWSGTKSEVLEASARRVWAFDDETVKAWTLNPASVEPYNALLDEMKQHVALRAKLSPASVTGKMVNLSAEALAAAEADQQRKLGTMRESHGESHEQLLGVSATMKGDTQTAQDKAAEVMWRDTEARSFGVMADGVLKIAQAIATGLPIGPLLPLVPGLTQQMISALEREIGKASVTNLVSSITQAAQQASQNPQVAAVAGQKTPEAPSAPAAA